MSPVYRSLAKKFGATGRNNAVLLIFCLWGDIMSPCELTASITAVANALACRLTVDELNLLGAVLTQLGDTLTTIATQKSICMGGQTNGNVSNSLPGQCG